MSKSNLALSRCCYEGFIIRREEHYCCSNCYNPVVVLTEKEYSEGKWMEN